MCTTVGFQYDKGVVFGRTLELGVELNNYVLYIPKNYADLITTNNTTYASKYALIGTGFVKQATVGDGINEMGLMGSSNLLPRYASFAKQAVEGKINLSTANAFNYLLSRCKDVAEVRDEAEKMLIVVEGDSEAEASASMHFFFKDATGSSVVLEPKEGKLIAYDNPYSTLTNAPEFPWHATNLKNYMNLSTKNIDKKEFGHVIQFKFGEGSSLVGLPGDFSPPSRFVRAAFFVANTPKNLNRQAAILQVFRILSQSDIPTGAVVDPENNNNDQTLYTAVMDTKKKGYFVKCHDNIDVQAFYLDDYSNEMQVKHIELKKQMSL